MPTHGIYLPTWMLDFYGFHVGKIYKRPMDPMENQIPKHAVILSENDWGVQITFETH